MDPRIILEGIKNSTTQTRTQEANYVVWQRQVNQGTSHETLVLPSFTGPTKPGFTAPGGLSVQIAEGDFRIQINTLGAQPGMGYLNDLAARKDVNWQPVKLALEQWNYQQEGLTPAGAALDKVHYNLLPVLKGREQVCDFLAPRYQDLRNYPKGFDTCILESN